jgi:hypothetical protein
VLSPHPLDPTRLLIRILDLQDLDLQDREVAREELAAALVRATTARTPLPTGRRIGEYLLREVRREL